MTDRQSSGRLLDFLKFVNHKTIFFFLFFLEAGKLSDYKYFVVVTNYQWWYWKLKDSLNNWQEAMKSIHLTNSSRFSDELYNRNMMALSEHLHLEDAGRIKRSTVQQYFPRLLLLLYYGCQVWCVLLPFFFFNRSAPMLFMKIEPYWKLCGFF